MPLVEPKERIRVLPTVTVCTLTEAIEEYMKIIQTRNLYQSLKGHFATKWKGAPNAKKLCQVGDLFRLLFSIGGCRNGKVPDRLLVMALQNMREKLALELPGGKDHDHLWADRLSQTIRGLAGHWRSLYDFKDVLERCLKKASPQEGDMIKKVISEITVKKNDIPKIHDGASQVQGKVIEKDEKESAGGASHVHAKVTEFDEKMCAGGASQVHRKVTEIDEKMCGAGASQVQTKITEIDEKMCVGGASEVQTKVTEIDEKMHVGGASQVQTQVNEIDEKMVGASEVQAKITEFDEKKCAGGATEVHARVTEIDEKCGAGASEVHTKVTEIDEKCEKMPPDSPDFKAILDYAGLWGG